MVLASFVIGLVSHTFLVQNEFYSTQTLRATAQDNVRSLTELVGREVRNSVEDGFVVAGRRTLTVRSPIAVGTVCNRQGSSIDVYAPSASTAFDSSDVAGLAVRNDSTWEYQYVNWGALNAGSGFSAGACAANGADTVGASADFRRISEPGLFSTAPSEGDVVMLFRESTYTIGTSQLDPSVDGVFRSTYGGAPIEFATGVDTTAGFQYRTGGVTYIDSVTAGSLAMVDAVRLSARATTRPATGGRDGVSFGWVVDLPVRALR